MDENPLLRVLLVFGVREAVLGAVQRGDILMDAGVVDIVWSTMRKFFLAGG
jgi:hypothetical protein